MDRIIAAQVFVRIAERGSLSGAAELLDMSRSMVTRYLSEMENWSGARLFHRSTRRISLTAAGEATLTRCRELLALANDMPLAGDAEADEPSGVLRIACAQSLAQASLAASVALFLQRYPRTAIDLQVGNKVVNLVEDRIDLAIRITNQLDPGLIARRLGSCSSVICAAPAYLQAHGTPLYAEDLTQHNCLTYTYFGKSQWNFKRENESINVQVSGNLSANESLVLLQATVQGAGISMQPIFSAAPLLANGKLVALLPQDQPETLGIYGIYTSREHQTAILRTMLDFLVSRFSQESES